MDAVGAAWVATKIASKDGHALDIRFTSGKKYRVGQKYGLS